MQTITFKYNYFQTVFTSFFIFVTMIILVSIAILVNEIDTWLILTVLTCIICGIARFFILNFSLPFMKGKPALTLDDEKLVSYISDYTIYWSNVVKYTRYYEITYGYFLFEMNNGDSFRVGTKWVEGDTNTIDNYIKYFMSHISHNK